MGDPELDSPFAHTHRVGWLARLPGWYAERRRPIIAGSVASFLAASLLMLIAVTDRPDRAGDARPAQQATNIPSWPALGVPVPLSPGSAPAPPSASLQPPYVPPGDYAGRATVALPGAQKPTRSTQTAAVTPPAAFPGAAPPGPPAPKPGATAAPAAPAAPVAPAAPPAPAPPDGTAYRTIQAEKFDGQSGVKSEAGKNGARHAGFISKGDWMRFEGLEFTDEPARVLVLRASNAARQNRTGRVELRLDRRSNAPLAGMTIPNNGDWFAFTTYRLTIPPTTGKHTVYLTFTSDQDEEFANIDWLTFQR